MIKRDVLLTIKGKILEGSEKDESLELFTEGEAFQESHQEGFRYDESEIYGVKGTTTSIIVSRDTVSIMRLGAVNSELHFSPNKRTVTLYSTPYGEVQVGILTKKISLALSDDNWITQIFIDYTIEVGSNPPLRNSIDVKIEYV